MAFDIDDVPDAIYEAAQDAAELDGDGYAVARVDGWEIAWEARTYRERGAFGAMETRWEFGEAVSVRFKEAA